MSNGPRGGEEVVYHWAKHIVSVRVFHWRKKYSKTGIQELNKWENWVSCRPFEIAIKINKFNVKIPFHRYCV